MSALESVLKLAIVSGLFVATTAFASVTITSATGGSNLSADQAGNAVSPAWTALGPIVVTEGNRRDFSAGSGLTLVLNAPAGFEFNTAAPPNITFTSGQDITSATLTMNNSTTITITISVGGTSGTDQLTIGSASGLQVRPTTGAPLASGQIFRPQSGGGTAVVNGIVSSSNADGSGGSNFGSLSEVVGAAAKLAFTTQPGAARTGALFGTQPVVKSQDQFGNNSVMGLATSNLVTVALTSGTGPLLGNTSLNIGTGVGNGTVTYTNLEIDVGGTNKQLTASASGLSAALSIVFTVNSPPTISIIPNVTTNENKVATNFFTISDLETPVDSLTLSANSSNTNVVSNTSIVFSGTGNNRVVTLFPSTNAFGSSTITISVSDGTLSSSNSFLLTVNSVNTPPTLNALTNRTILEDAGPQTVNLSGISPGPSNESTQTVSITATSSNPSLIPNPTVNYTNPSSTGTLSFASLTNQFGTTAISVVVKDNGGTANGGIDSVTNSFTVTVQAVNEPPTLDPINDVVVNPNAGLQTILLTGISPGPSNESTQVVTITASSSNPSVVSNLTVSYTNPGTSGTLTFAPVTNATGIATITVTAKDNGGTANGGQDTMNRQFTVTVTPVADLAISQVAIPNPAFSGGNITFKLTVTNLGPTAASGIQLTNILPAGIGSVSVAPSQGSYTNYGSMVVCNLGTLTNGGAATVSVIVEPLALGSYTNLASVSSSVPDPNPANNSSSAVDTVVPSQFTISGTALVSESCTNGGIDPAERVTVSFAVQNSSSFSTTNMVATLKATGGVTAPSSPQTYGVLTAGGPAVSRNFSFTPVGYCGGTFTATLQLQDGPVSLGVVTYSFFFGGLVSQPTSFANTNFVSIPSSGTATPYPSVVTVSGLDTNLVDLTVTLNRVTHTQPGDLEILLVGPGGQKTWLMSDCGGTNVINNVTLTFDDAAASNLPGPQGQIVSGTFKPTDYPPDDVLAAPAPAGPYVADLSVFNGTDPNGTWQLFVYDDSTIFSGSIGGGWTLNVGTLQPACCVDRNSIDVALTDISAAPSPVVAGQNVTFTITATNRGPAAATGTMITNPIPANATFVSATSSQGSCSIIGGAAVCSLGTLTNAAGASMSVTLQTSQPGTIVDSATISANEPDRTLSNNVASGSVVVSVPAISIGDATVSEGNAGTTTNAVFMLRLSLPGNQTISVDYATFDITATAGSDYRATNGTVVFSPGQTNKTISVVVLGDNLNEAGEFFGVALTNPVNATLRDTPGTGTILDDDPLPTLSISDASVGEGNSGTTNMLFTVTLSPVSGQQVSFYFETADGSAIAGTDYVATNGTLFLNAGQTNLVVAVPVIGNTLNESNKTFFVNLSGIVNATFARSQALGTIIDDDFLATVAPVGATLSAENCSPTNGVIDPNEAVTVNFALRNVSQGTASTTNLTASLLQLGGIISPGAAQAYGALTPGGAPVSRPFTFTANGICGDTLMAVLQLQDGANSLGMVTNFLPMGRAGLVTNTFANSTALTIPDSGPASDYPSTINVTGLSPNAIRVTATLSGLNHTYPSDLEILLVGPGGQNVLLMSDAGDSQSINNVSLTFDDNSASYLPVSSQISSGTYKPTDYPPDDPFLSPAPPGPYGTNLAVFNGTNPNGPWNLYVYDDSVGDSGSVAGGWSLRIASPGPATCCGGNSLADLNPGLTSSVAAIGIGSNITYTINVTNFGPNPASDVTLVDTLPSIVSFVSVTSSIGSTATQDGLVTCYLGTMTNGARANISIVVRTTTDGSATNSVTVFSRAADPNPANNSLNNVTTVLPPPHLAVNPTLLDFGQVVVGRSTNFSFQVLNTGGLPLYGSLTASPPYAVVSGSSYTVPGYSSTNVIVSFAPTFVGNSSNAVVFTSNGGNSTNTVIGYGLPAAELVVSPSVLSFGYVAVGSNALASFVVTNAGAGIATNVAVSLGPDGPFTIISATSFRLDGFGATNVVLRFTPTGAANFSNTVVFLSDAGNRTNTVTGQGAFVPVADFSAGPTFGAWPMSVTFTNLATGTITNQLWDFGDGATSNTASATLTHTYSTAATNSVSLTTTGPVGTNTRTRANYIVVVNPPRLVISPTNIDFGGIGLGRTNVQTFQLVNVGGLDATGSVATTPPFYLGTNGFIVAPSQTSHIDVAFIPDSLGSFSNAVIFTGNGGNFTNPVTGTGITPAQLSVSPLSFDFGAVVVGSNVQATFVASNLGQEALAGGSASVDGAPFSILSGTPFNLDGFGSTNIVVNFAPSGATASSDFLVITTGNAGNSTNAVGGSGAYIPLASFSANPTKGYWPLAVTFADSSGGTITNRVWDFGDGTTSNTTATVLTHTYSGPSTNNVTLTVSGPVGVSTVVSNGCVVVTNLPPKLVVSPSSLNFGSVVLGQSRTQVFAAFNSGQLALTGSVTAALPFSVVNPGGGGFSLGLSQTGLVQVAFTPTQAGSFNSQALFTSNGGNSTNTLTGTGLAPAQLAVSPPSLNFGIVAIGTNAQASFVVTNLGDLTASNAVASVGAGPFSILGSSSFNVPGHRSTNIVIRFAPGSEAVFTNNVVFVFAEGGGSTNGVAGIGMIPVVASFSGSPVGGLAPLTVTFTDSSTGTITNRLWNFGDGSSTNTAATSLAHVYQVGGSFGVSLTVSGPAGLNTQTRSGYINATNVSPSADFAGSPASGSAPLGVTFTDISTGTVTNRLWDFGDGSSSNTTSAQVLHVYAGPGTFRVKLTVTGPLGSNFKQRNNYISVTNAPAKLLVTPSSQNFGGVATGASSALPFQVINLGSFSLTGAVTTTLPFSIASPGGPGFTLAGGQTSSVLVAFSPPSTSSYSANVVFTSGGGNSTNTVAGSGLTPPRLVVTPSGLDFGLTPVGSSAQASFSATNLGAATLSNCTASLGAGPFSIVSSTPFDLPGFGFTNILVSFSPMNVGSFSNVVIFNSSNGGVSTNVLTGSGSTPPQLRVAPSGLNFGLAMVGANVQGSFVATNLGSLALSNCIVPLSGGPFSIISPTPFDLPGFGSTNVVFNFSPTSEGSFSNVVIFTSSNGGASTNGLSGAGASLPVADFVASPSNGYAPLTVTFNDNSSGTITNRSWDFGDSSTTNTTATSFNHIFSAAATNAVVLTVSGPLGSSTITNYITSITANPLLITSIQIVDPDVLVGFASTVGQTYRLEFADDLTLSAWQTAADNVAGTGDVVFATHLGGASQPLRFYRVRLLTGSD